jgi:hypothetical protein
VSSLLKHPPIAWMWWTGSLLGSRGKRISLLRAWPGNGAKKLGVKSDDYMVCVHLCRRSSEGRVKRFVRTVWRHIVDARAWPTWYPPARDVTFLANAGSVRA